jgi:hypothetical protein
MTRKIEIERFSLTTSKPFDEVIAGVNAGIGYPEMAEFGRSSVIKSFIFNHLGTFGARATEYH